MTYREAVNDFKRDYSFLYIKKIDYWAAHEAWAGYIDALNKDGDITDKQASTWATPFPYGKSLKPSRKQLEDAVYD